jgi:hypothetical protein
MSSRRVALRRGRSRRSRGGDCWNVPTVRWGVRNKKMSEGPSRRRETLFCQGEGRGLESRLRFSKEIPVQSQGFIEVALHLENPTQILVGGEWGDPGGRCRVRRWKELTHYRGRFRRA